MKSFNPPIIFRSLLSLLIVLLASAAFAQAPKTLSYQGKLSDGGGPLNGTYTLTFTLYDAATGGSSVWTETSTNVSITSGNLSLILGKTTPINIASDKPLWLGIKVGANPEVTPRVEMAGSLYSLGIGLPYAATSNRPASLFSITATADGARAGEFTHLGINSGQAALFATSTGGNLAFQALNSGSNESSALFFMQNAASFAPNVKMFSGALGKGLDISLTNPTNNSAALAISHSGTGNAITANRPIQASQFIGDGSLLTNLPGGFNLPFNGTGNDSNPIFSVTNNGTGATGVFTNSATGNGLALYARTSSLGSAASLYVANGSNNSPALSINHQGTGNGITANSPIQATQFISNFSGVNGGAGSFTINNSSNGYPAISVLTTGTGIGGYFNISNATSSSDALASQTSGLGRAGTFNIQNEANGNAAVGGFTQGSGSAADFRILNASNSAPVVNIVNSGTGNSITANSPIQATKFIGDGSLLTNLPTSGLSLPFSGSSNSGVAAFNINKDGTEGAAASFFINNASNSSAVLDVATVGNGPAISIDHFGTGNAITANRPIQATQFIGDGSLLTNLPSGGLQVGSAVGNTAYWNGTAWVNDSNIFNSGGTIGIGTSTPFSLYKLDINGDVRLGKPSIFSGPNAKHNFTLASNSGYNIFRVAYDGYDGGFWGNLFFGPSGPGTITPNSSHNIGIGGHSLQFLTTGSNNVTLGWTSLYQNTSGGGNVAIGGQGSLRSNTTGNNNVSIGHLSMYANTTGNNNIGLGYGAGYTATTANANVTGSNNTFIGHNSGPGTPSQLTNATAIGYNAQVTQNNMVRLGDTNVTVIQGQVGFTAASDQRFKMDIHSLNEGLDFILKLRPVSYKMKSDGGGKTNWGFIAQDIEKLLGTQNAILTIGGDEERLLGLRYSDFVAPLTKAVQEQQQTIESLKAEIASMKTQHQTVVGKLEAENSQLKSDIESRLKKMETILGMKADATTTTKAKE